MLLELITDLKGPSSPLKTTLINYDNSTARKGFSSNKKQGNIKTYFDLRGPSLNELTEAN